MTPLLAIPVVAILGLGGGEMLVIGLIALLLFGTRLPKLARSLGQSVNEFKQGMKDSPKPGDPDHPGTVSGEGPGHVPGHGDVRR